MPPLPRSAAIVLTALCLTQACGTSTAAPSPAPSSPGPPSPASTAPTGHPLVRVELDLQATSVPAGTPLKGSITFENLTAHRLTIGCGLNYAVGVSNAQVPFRPAFPAMCRPNQYLAPGRTTYQTSIDTTYGSCSQSGHQDGNTPGCRLGPPGAGSSYTVAPPLPKGGYVTAVVVSGIPPGEVELPQPMSITLR